MMLWTYQKSLGTSPVTLFTLSEISEYEVFLLLNIILKPQNRQAWILSPQGYLKSQLK